MKWNKSIIIIMIMGYLISLSAFADTGIIETYLPNQIFGIPIHVSNITGNVIGANCSTEIRYSNFSVAAILPMNEIEGGWYNVTYNTSETGYYYCSHNCTQGTQYTSGTCDFKIGDSMTPEAISIILIILSVIICTIFFILALKFGDFNFALLSGMLFCILGIYIFIYGFAGVINLISNSLSMILIGIGCIILFRTSVEMMEEAER